MQERLVSVLVSEVVFCLRIIICTIYTVRHVGLSDRQLRNVEKLERGYKTSALLKWVTVKNVAQCILP